MVSRKATHEYFMSVDIGRQDSVAIFHPQLGLISMRNVDPIKPSQSWSLVGEGGERQRRVNLSCLALKKYLNYSLNFGVHKILETHNTLRCEQKIR